MTVQRDWIPSADVEYVKMCNRWTMVLDDPEKVTAFGWLSESCKELSKAIVAYLHARSAYESNDSTTSRNRKNTTKMEAVHLMRMFANSSIRYNPLMDEATKLALGIRMRDTTPTPQPKPIGQPDTQVETTANRFEHRLKAINRETHTLTKPADAHGVRFAWQVGGERPNSGAELPRSKFSRKTTMISSYSEIDSGKRVWYASCYENNRGDAGPWSAIAEAFIF